MCNIKKVEKKYRENLDVLYKIASEETRYSTMERG